MNDGVGQAASLGSMDSYIGYAGSRLKPDQGTILFRYKPVRDLAGAFATRPLGWTDFGQNKPPQIGFLLDTIGWTGLGVSMFLTRCHIWGDRMAGCNAESIRRFRCSSKM